MAIENVLVAVGQSDIERTSELAEAAAEVAGPAGATVTIAHVFSEEGFEDVVSQLDYQPGTGASADPDEVAQRYRAIRDIADVFEDADIEYAIRGEVAAEADRGVAIVDIAEESDADMVFVGGRRRSPTGKAIFGSTAQHVLMNAPCPVTFVRSG